MGKELKIRNRLMRIKKFHFSSICYANRKCLESVVLKSTKKKKKCAILQVFYWLLIIVDFFFFFPRHFRCYRNFQIVVEQRGVGVLEPGGHGQLVRRFGAATTSGRAVPVGTAGPAAPGFRPTAVHSAHAQSAGGAPDTGRSQQQVVA